MNKILKNKSKAQVSLEVLIMISVFVIGAIVVAVLFIGNVENAKDTSSNDGLNDLVNDFGDDVEENIGNGSQPGLTASILEPSQHQYVTNGSIATVPLEAKYSNYTGTVNCQWRIKTAGATVDVTSCDQITALPEGNYDIDLTVTDNDDTVTDSTTIDVVDEPGLTASILEPANSEYEIDTSIPGLTTHDVPLIAQYDNFTGYHMINWKIWKLEAGFGNVLVDEKTGVTSQVTLSKGNYKIDLNVTDDDETVIVSKNISIVEPVNPGVFSASILSPSNNSQYTHLQTINFKMTYDYNTGPISCTWTDYFNHTQLSRDCNFSTILSDIGSHNIELNVNDGSTTVTDSINIIIVDSCDLIINIDSPVEGGHYAKDTIIDFNTTLDTRTGYSCIWEVCNPHSRCKIFTGCDTTHTFTETGNYSVDVNVTLGACLDTNSLSNIIITD